MPDGARLAVVDRNGPDALRALEGERFDSVVEVATMALPWVREALEVLAPGAAHWTFVSSINAYADTATTRTAVDAPLLEPVTDHEVVPLHDLDPEELAEVDAALNGRIKVASENAVRGLVGEDRAFLVRPGLITGPEDLSDRFGYWPARFNRGGQVVVPDAPDQPIQHIDVRDLATWLVDAGEQRLSGAYDAVGPITALGPFLREVAELSGTEDTELVPPRPRSSPKRA